jgi:hypothetical protein
VVINHNMDFGSRSCWVNRRARTERLASRTQTIPASLISQRDVGVLGSALDREHTCSSQVRRDFGLAPLTRVRTQGSENSVWSLRTLDIEGNHRTCDLCPANDLAFSCERAGVNSVECTTVARVCQVQRLVRPSATRKAKTHGKPRCFAPATSFHAHRAGAWRSSGRIDRDLVAQHCDAEDRRKRVAIDPRNLSRSHCLTRAHPRAPCPRAHNRGASNS